MTRSFSADAGTCKDGRTQYGRNGRGSRPLAKSDWPSKIFFIEVMDDKTAIRAPLTLQVQGASVCGHTNLTKYLALYETPCPARVGGSSASTKLEQIP